MSIVGIGACFALRYLLNRRTVDEEEGGREGGKYSPHPRAATKWLVRSRHEFDHELQCDDACKMTALMTARRSLAWNLGSREALPERERVLDFPHAPRTRIAKPCFLEVSWWHT